MLLFVLHTDEDKDEVMCCFSYVLCSQDGMDRRGTAITTYKHNIQTHTHAHTNNHTQDGPEAVGSPQAGQVASPRVGDVDRRGTAVMTSAELAAKLLPVNYTDLSKPLSPR